MSAAPKFTPGPWSIECWRDRPNAFHNVEAAGLAYPQNKVALVDTDSQAATANAHLIAAAPDLYAALETMERRYCAALDIIRTLGRGDPEDPNDGQPDPETSTAVLAARAALAKARGES